MREHFAKEMQARAKDQENVKISALTKTKLLGDLKEFDLLRYTFSATRVFFHD